VTLAALCYDALRYSGVTSLARRLTGGGVVLCYHNVVAAGGADALGLHMPLATFERQMRWLRDHYAVIPLEELVSRQLRGRSLRGVAAVTFDDAYAGVFDHAWPLLRDLGVPATVFVVADAPGSEQGFWWDDPDVLRAGAHAPDLHHRWLTAFRGDRTAIVRSVAPHRAPRYPEPTHRPATWHTIAAAAASGLHIGVHSASHRSLPELPDEELQREIVGSRDVIERHAGVAPLFFTYPYGLWNDRVRLAVRAAGYRAAFTLSAAARIAKADPWALPRVNVPAGIADAAFQAWTARLSLRRG
jgi:peptidoglycan/xylan/chitin deacetylase (PgdA/CDA1 family)